MTFIGPNLHGQNNYTAKLIFIRCYCGNAGISDNLVSSKSTQYMLCSNEIPRLFLVIESPSLTFHGPMIDCGLSDEGNGVEVDPFPEDYIICHLVCLHFALHLNVENLEIFSS